MLMPSLPATTTAALLLLAASATAGGARADGVVRHPLLNSDLPILSAVEIPPGKTLVVLSGAGAPVSDLAAPARSLAAYGDTRAQTVGALTGIAGTLKGAGTDAGRRGQHDRVPGRRPGKERPDGLRRLHARLPPVLRRTGPAPASHPVHGAGRRPGEPWVARGDRSYSSPAVRASGGRTAALSRRRAKLRGAHGGSDPARRAGSLPSRPPLLKIRIFVVVLASPKQQTDRVPGASAPKLPLCWDARYYAGSELGATAFIPWVPPRNSTSARFTTSLASSCGQWPTPSIDRNPRRSVALRATSGS